MSDAVLDLTRRVVAFDTTSAKTNLPLIELLADRLDALGCRVRTQTWDVAGVTKANLVAILGPAEADGLTVSGHTDTVPFEGQPGWTRDPLALEVGDDRVYGRGTSDMKTFIVHTIEAARSIDAAKLRRPLVFAFTADEEVGCLGAARLAPEFAALLGGAPLPTLCWIGEPTSWEIFHTHKSYALFEIRVRGRGGHSGLPEAGTSAIGAASAVLAEIGRYQAELRANPSPAFTRIFPDSPYTTVNFGTIHGGTAANMIAEDCKLYVSTRGLPDLDPLDPYREIERRLAAIEARDPASPTRAAEITLGEPTAVPALLAARGTALERALMARLGEREVAGALFGADGCRWQALGVNSLLCGPGDFAEAHQPNESISRTAFETGADVIRSVITSLLL